MLMTIYALMAILMFVTNVRHKGFLRAVIQGLFWPLIFVFSVFTLIYFFIRPKTAHAELPPFECDFHPEIVSGVVSTIIDHATEGKYISYCPQCGQLYLLKRNLLTKGYKVISVRRLHHLVSYLNEMRDFKAYQSKSRPDITFIDEALGQIGVRGKVSKALISDGELSLDSELGVNTSDGNFGHSIHTTKLSNREEHLRKLHYEARVNQLQAPQRLANIAEKYRGVTTQSQAFCHFWKERDLI